MIKRYILPAKKEDHYVNSISKKDFINLTSEALYNQIVNGKSFKSKNCLYTIKKRGK
jgi:hypothetical protein